MKNRSFSYTAISITAFGARLLVTTLALLIAITLFGCSSSIGNNDSDASKLPPIESGNNNTVCEENRNQENNSSFVVADHILEPVWMKSLGESDGGSFGSVIQASDGSIVAVGSYRASGNSLPESKGGVDAFIAKFDNTGNLIWIKGFGSSDNDGFGSVVESPDGGYVAVGCHIGVNGSRPKDGDLANLQGVGDAIIAKFDSNGNLVWVNNAGGTYSSFYKVILTDDGGFLATGEAGGDGIIARFDSSGNLLWTKKYGGSRFDIFGSIVQTADGNFVAVGSSDSSNGDVPGNNGDADAIVAKIDPNGDLIWMKNIGGDDLDQFCSVVQTADGGVIAIGNSRSKNGDIPNNKGYFDAIIARFDSQGNLIWIKSIDGIGNEVLLEVALTLDGGFIAVGHTSSSSGDLLDSLTKHSVLFIKFDLQGTIEWIDTFFIDDGCEFGTVLQTTDGAFIAAGQSNNALIVCFEKT